jgi:hypothetical protein
MDLPALSIDQKISEYSEMVLVLKKTWKHKKYTKKEYTFTNNLVAYND